MAVKAASVVLLPLELSAGQQCELFLTLWNGHEEFSHSLRCTQQNKLKELTENQLLKIYKEGLNLKGAQTSSRSLFLVIIGIFAYNKRETRIKVRP